jgi:hypothetical protein
MFSYIRTSTSGSSVFSSLPFSYSTVRSVIRLLVIRPSVIFCSFIRCLISQHSVTQSTRSVPSNSSLPGQDRHPQDLEIPAEFQLQSCENNIKNNSINIPAVTVKDRYSLLQFVKHFLSTGGKNHS